MNYITPTGVYAEHEQMLAGAQALIERAGWGHTNQILLTSRPGDANPWHDGVGTVIDRVTGKRIIHESDFTVWNDIPEYIKNSLITLSQKRGVKYGRIRIMRLMPHRGLSVHADYETRYHYVLTTNPKSYFGFSQFGNTEQPAAVCWHMPVDGQWHHVDTTKHHFVYNGGETERIHIVACALNG